LKHPESGSGVIRTCRVRTAAARSTSANSPSTESPCSAALQASGTQPCSSIPTSSPNLDRSDTAAAQSRRTIDDFITACGIDTALDPVVDPVLPDPLVRSELDLAEADTTTIVWATCYRLDFSWIAVPGLCDEYGYPWHQRGITRHPGLSFLGLPWLHSEASSLLLGMETDAPYLIEQLTRLVTTWRRRPAPSGARHLNQ
jgi:hypothetical protein